MGSMHHGHWTRATRDARAEPGQAVFEATDPASDVQRIVYRARGPTAPSTRQPVARTEGPQSGRIYVEQGGL